MESYEFNFLNDDKKIVLMQTSQKFKNVAFESKKFRSENWFPIAQYSILGNDAYIKISQTGKTFGKYRHFYFKIPNFKETSISEIQLAINKVFPDDLYPFGMNFDNCLQELHQFGLQVYPSYLRKLK